MSEAQTFRFKKDDPNYYNERKQKLNEQTKARYASNPAARENAKKRARLQYQEMRKALLESRTKMSISP